LPIEVVPFGWETTAARLRRLETEPVLRKGSDGQPFRTDGGNLILDCRFGSITDPAGLDLAIRRTIGVVETGLFIGMADTVIVGADDGIVRYSRAGATATPTP
jgi:ribose 5-phosphate isomerase A